MRLHSACRAAGIHDFIISLPEGYETAVGAKGLALSGVRFHNFPDTFQLLLDSLHCPTWLLTTFIPGTETKDSNCESSNQEAEAAITG
jgi:hypothetical protein